MQVSQVAYDRFVLELPAADNEWKPLADPEIVAETAAWLWDFGPTPLIGVVGYDKTGAAPAWLSRWQSRQVSWAPDGTTAGRAVILADQTDLERFLAAGAPHEHTSSGTARSSRSARSTRTNDEPRAGYAAALLLDARPIANPMSAPTMATPSAATPPGGKTEAWATAISTIGIGKPTQSAMSHQRRGASAASVIEAMSSSPTSIPVSSVRRS